MAMMHVMIMPQGTIIGDMRICQMPRKLRIIKFDASPPRLFKFGTGIIQGFNIIRIDILYKSVLIVYRGKAWDQYMEGIAYGYL